MARAVWLAMYVLAVLLANVFLGDFIKLPWFGLFSIGSIFFAAVFTLRDRLHGYGLGTVYFGIAMALLVNTAYGQWVSHISPRFLLASFTAILVGELADTAMFHRMRGHGWYTRVLSSNAVSVPLDSTSFTLLAFAGVMSAYNIGQIIFVDVVGKFIIAGLVACLPFVRMRRGQAISPAAREPAPSPVPTITPTQA